MIRRILLLALVFVPLFLVAYFWCVINPAESYEWLDGIWDGICFVPNYVFSICGEGRIFKAVSFTPAYNICWWIFTVLSVIQALRYILTFLFGSIRRR